MAGEFAVLSGTMPRPLHIEFPGAIYHLMNRGDRRDPIFRDDQDRRSVRSTKGAHHASLGQRPRSACPPDDEG